MIRSLIVCLAVCLAAGAAAAETDPALAARRAAQQLDHAALALQEADRARDRVAALTQTVRAYEAGLVAMREGLRRAAIRQQALRLEFDARQAEISRLLGVLQTMQRSPETMLLLHPSGALGTARSGMILSEVTPALQARAEALRDDLEEVAVLRALQQSAADTLVEGLAGAQTARTALSKAISDRTDLPRRFIADTDAMRQLLESSDTLEGFASGLASLDDLSDSQPLAAFDTRRGALSLPVQGTLLRRFDEPDAAGIRRPGVLLATRPLALVTTPAPATIRYLGPLLDYGNVMILEPDGRYLLILAGMAEVYGEVGQVLPEGAPVGLMGGKSPNVDAFLSIATEGGGTDRPETLYMELREGKTPVDPAEWFKVNKE